MKKFVLTLTVLFCAAIPCRALDLILKNGETLYNVSHVVPLFSRVHMVTHPPDGLNGDWGIMFKTVRYRDLMPQSLLALQQYLLQRGRSLPANIWTPLNGNGRITFYALRKQRSGTVGYLDGTTQRIYIRGLLIPAGSIWHGYIQPERGFFPYQSISVPVYSVK